jgi:hypothetical protein
MRHSTWIAPVLLGLIAPALSHGGEPLCTEQPPTCSQWRLGPLGGLCPYGGGLLRWWPHDCFPHCGGPDDYSRKSLPCVCWPPYPPYYIWGPPEACCPQTNANSHGNCNK